MAGGDDPESSKDPYNDPFHESGHFTEEAVRNVMSDNNPNLMNLSDINADLVNLTVTEAPLLLPPPPPPPPTQAMEISETQWSQELSYPFSDFQTSDEFLDDLALSWNMSEFLPMNDLNINNNDNVIGTSRIDVSTRVFGDNNGPNFEIGGTSAIPVPVTPQTTEGILLCTCCNHLRQIVHTNGYETRRLDIHGGYGFYCHAILETHVFETNQRRHQTLILKDLRMEDVMKFIEDYCSWKVQCGFSLAYDSNAWSINNQLLPPQFHVPRRSLLTSYDPAFDFPMPFYVGLGEDLKKKKKVKERRQTPLAAQRERTGKMTVKDMSKVFHLPMKEAAKKMKVCSTVVKKVCRRGGLFRWPYRKIKSIKKKIAELKSELSMTSDAKERARLEQQIERLQQRINDLCRQTLQNFQ